MLIVSKLRMKLKIIVLYYKFEELNKKLYIINLINHIFPLVTLIVPEIYQFHQINVKIFRIFLITFLVFKLGAFR